MENQYNYSLVLLGGTGARCGEIFIHMCANGYFKGEEVNILFIDSDTDNGNAANLKRLVDLYHKCQEKYRIEASPLPCFFRPRINFMIENPVQDVEYFKDLVNYEHVDMEGRRKVEMLMRALYSDEEYNMKISDGFFAHPNVGAAMFAANMEKIMHHFEKYISIAQKDSKKIKIFMVGSIFGGTGASSLPTISKYLKTKLYGESKDKLIGDKLKIGGCMLLPYFSFSRKNVLKKLKENIEEVEIESDKFSTKTREALKYYKYIDQDKERKIFDQLYILGHDEKNLRGIYETAGSSQKNMPHIVEFYAAMTGITFFTDTEMENGSKYFSVIQRERIKWNGFYDAKTCFCSFLFMMRFSIVLESLFLEELFEYENNKKLKKNARDIPWFYDFLNGRETVVDFEHEKLAEEFEPIEKYCKEYIRWFAELYIKDIEKRERPDNICGKELDKQGNDDIVEYLDLFEKSILLRQYYNNLIKDGKFSDLYLEDAIRKMYEENIKYIREHFKELGKTTDFTDFKTDIKMEDIWDRVSDLGFSNLIRVEGILENLDKMKNKSMSEGVKNLINAIYIACMI